MPDSSPKLEINGTSYPFIRPEAMTLGEAHLLKKNSGVRIGELSDALEAGDAAVIASLVLISMRRVDPRKTFEEILLMDLTEVFDAIGNAMSEDPEVEGDNSPNVEAPAEGE